MYTVAIDLGATKTRLAVMAAQAEPAAEVRLLSAELMNRGAAESLANAVRAICSEARVPLSALRGVGIGVPGIFDQNAQVIRLCSNLPQLDGVPLGQQLSRLLGLPVVVENDVNLIALGEHLRGRGQGIDDMACVMVGSGIGLGMIVGGKLYGGAAGAAGELGHYAAVPGGRPCTCGQRGCLEMYCSGKALALQADYVHTGVHRSDEWTQHVKWSAAERVFAAAKNGDGRARAVLDEAFYYLSTGMAMLANILNPRLIILGGGILTAWPQGLDMVRHHVQRMAQPVIRDVQIEPPSLGEHAGLIGAVAVIQSRGSNS